MSSIPDIRDRLGFKSDAAHWYDTWEAFGEPQPPVSLPSAEAVEQLLADRLKVDPVDVAAALDARPDPDRDPELWWLLERCHLQLVAEMGGTGMLSWPRVPAEWGEIGRFIYLYAFVATIPQVLDYHRKRGIDESISWATFGNLAEKLRLNRARLSVTGLDVSFWFTLHFRGALYRLGRLEFATETLGADLAIPGHDAGEPTLGVHIPGEGLPMTPQACEESIARARDFFPRHFGDRFATLPMFTCSSWLLDPQLREFLPADSNIVRFQELFTLAPPAPAATQNGEKDVLLFVFDKVGAVDPLTLPRDSTLRRHLADGLTGGNRWQVRTGYFNG